MYRLFLLLFITLAVISPARSQVGLSEVNDYTTVRWNRDTLDFQVIEEGTILLDSFVVTNTGTVPYQIYSVRSSCDCTVLRYPKTPVQPGKSASIRIEFDSQGKAGNTQPGIVVYDNSSPNLRSILYLNGHVKPRRKSKNSLRF